MKQIARKILMQLANTFLEPTVYPTFDRQIAIYFESPVDPAAVLVHINEESEICWITSFFGKNNSKKYPVYCRDAIKEISEKIGYLENISVSSSK